jgi:hypothetical protein
MRWLLAMWVYSAAAASLVVGSLVAFAPYGSLWGGTLLILQGLGLAVGFSLYLKESAPRRSVPHLSEFPVYSPRSTSSLTRTGIVSSAAAASPRTHGPSSKPDSNTDKDPNEHDAGSVPPGSHADVLIGSAGTKTREPVPQRARSL